MKTTRSIRLASALVAMATLQLSTHGDAQAASALFRTYWDPTVRVAQVGSTTPAPRVTLPAEAYRITNFTTTVCPPYCRPFYAVTRYYISIWNSSAAVFEPNNPYAPTYATTFTVPPPNTSSITPYAYGRDYGKIRVTPGSNRFGGTLRFFHGPNDSNYQRMTYSPLCCSGSLTVTGRWNPLAPTGMIPQTLGYSHLAWSGVRRFTSRTTGPPSYLPLTREVKTFYTTGPWTTGRVEVYNASPIDAVTFTGYDNRTAKGLNGVLSMIKPTLVNNYVKLPSGQVHPNRHEARLQFVTIEFLPEPQALLSIAVGSTLLAGLYRSRRR